MSIYVNAQKKNQNIAAWSSKNALHKPIPFPAKNQVINNPRTSVLTKCHGVGHLGSVARV
jgi:hypothetical protein